MATEKLLNGVGVKSSLYVQANSNSKEKNEQPFVGINISKYNKAFGLEGVQTFALNSKCEMVLMRLLWCEDV